MKVISCSVADFVLNDCWTRAAADAESGGTYERGTGVCIEVVVWVTVGPVGFETLVALAVTVLVFVVVVFGRINKSAPNPNPIPTIPAAARLSSPL